MVFNTLTASLQNVYIENFNFLYKFLLILCFFLVSFWIIKNWTPKQAKNSKFIMVKWIKLTYYLLAWVYLSLIPLHLGYLSPAVSLSTVLSPVILFYSLNFIVLGIIITLNILIHGSAFVTDIFDGGNRADAIKKPLLQFINEPNTPK